MLIGVLSIYNSLLNIYISSLTPDGLSSVNRIFLIVAGSVVIVVALIRLMFEAFQFINLKAYYIFDWVNWIEVILFLCSILFVSVFNTDCLCPTRWQWQLGCIAVFLTWIDLIIFIRKLPLTGNSLVTPTERGIVVSVDF